MKKLSIGIFVCISLMIFGEVRADEIVTHMSFMAYELLSCSQDHSYPQSVCGKEKDYSHCIGGSDRYAWDFNLNGDRDYGLPITATFAGRVVFVGKHSDYGNLVVVYSGERRIAAYFAHLIEHIVNLGEYVEEGQAIGFLGNTGYSTGPHLHYRVDIDCSNTLPSESYRRPECSTESTNILYFQNGNGVIGDPQEGYSYTSINDNLFAKRHFEGDWLNPVGEHQNRGDKDIPAHGIFGNVKDNPTSIHWWHTPLFGMTNWDRNYFRDGSSRNCYIQEYEGTPEQGAIVYDAFGGARRAYIVGWQQWNTWSGLDTPYDQDDTGNQNYDPNYNEFHEGGPNSVCSMPITDSYYDSNVWRQDFIKCYMLYGDVHYWNPAGPGWFTHDKGWRKDLSYLFAEAYERNGASLYVGVPTAEYDKSTGGGVHKWILPSDNPNTERFVWVQDYSQGRNGRGMIMYDPEALNGDPHAEVKAWYMPSTTLDAYFQSGNPEGKLSSVASDPICFDANCNKTKIDNCKYYKQYFKGGWLEKTAQYWVTLDFEENPINHSDNYRGERLCQNSTTSMSTMDAQSSCDLPELVHGQSIFWQDTDWIKYYYLKHEDDLVYLTTRPLRTAWEAEITAQKVSRCAVDNAHPISVDDKKEASFPNQSTVYQKRLDRYLILQDGTWHQLRNATTYKWYQNYKGVGALTTYIDDYELSMFPEGDIINIECPITPHIPQHAVVQVADYDGALTDWYFLHHSDKMLWIPTDNIYKTWLKEGPYQVPIEVQRCIMDRIQKDDILNYPEIIFPEGFSVIHQTSGKVLVKNNNQWHWVTDETSWKYYMKQFGIKEQTTSINDYEFSLLPLGKHWSKPDECATTFHLPHGTMIQTIGDDGAWWPYRYIMYHGQLVYTTRDSQWKSYGTEDMFVPVNHCVVDNMNPIPADKIPIAAFKDHTVVHHNPTGNIYILDAYEWHLFPIWDDYMYFVNTYGISKNRINIGDKDLAFYPIGYSWTQPTEEEVDPPTSTIPQIIPQTEPAPFYEQKKKEPSEESGPFLHGSALKEKVKYMLHEILD